MMGGVEVDSMIERFGSDVDTSESNEELADDDDGDEEEEEEEVEKEEEEGGSEVAERMKFCTLRTEEGVGASERRGSGKLLSFNFAGVTNTLSTFSFDDSAEEEADKEEEEEEEEEFGGEEEVGRVTK